MLKVLSADVRVRIVQLLKGRSLCVNALAARLDVTQGAVSQHLRVMRDAGLVVDERRGYYVHYRLDERALARWRKEIDALLGSAADDMGSRKGRLGARRAREATSSRSRKEKGHVRP
jgi:DNA-binding transcriptional ArsR family regulator